MILMNWTIIVNQKNTKQAVKFSSEEQDNLSESKKYSEIILG